MSLHILIRYFLRARVKGRGAPKHDFFETCLTSRFRRCAALVVRSNKAVGVVMRRCRRGRESHDTTPRRQCEFKMTDYIFIKIDRGLEQQKIAFSKCIAGFKYINNSRVSKFQRLKWLKINI